MVKIGFEYGRSIIGEELTIDLDHYENDQTAVDPQEESTLVTSSDGLLEELGLNAYDLVGEEVGPSSSTPGPSSSTPGPSPSGLSAPSFATPTTPTSGKFNH